VTQEPSRSGPDPIGDLQRWLVRSSARNMSREVSGQLRSALGRRGGHGDVWERATALPADEPPECAWCPICRAARAMRDSGPGVPSQVSAVGDAMSTLVHDTLSAFESALAAGRAATPATPRTGTDEAPPATVWADVADVTDVTAPDAAQVPDAGEEPGLEAVSDRGEAPGLGEVPGPGKAPGPGEVPGPGKVPDLGEVDDLGEVPGPGEVRDPGEEPDSTGSPEGPPREPDDRG
jgi:hypothetical protein